MSRRILIVEDDIDIARNLKEILEDEGYEVMLAKDGRDALGKLALADPLPALIFLDLMMPVLDGFQFRAEQARDPRISGIPVVIMSADGHIEEKRQKSGAQAFIRKPIDLQTVLDVTSKYQRAN